MRFSDAVRCARALRWLRCRPFPLTSVLNQGCKLEVLAPLPADQPIRCTAQVVDVQDGRASPALSARATCVSALEWNPTQRHK